MTKTYTLKEIAAILQVHLLQVYRLVHAGKLQVFNVGIGKRRKLYRVSDEAVAVFMATRAVRPPQLDLDKCPTTVVGP